MPSQSASIGQIALFDKHFTTTQQQHPDESVDQFQRRFILHELTTRSGIERFASHCRALLGWRAAGDGSRDRRDAMQEHEFVRVIQTWCPSVSDVDALDMFDAIDHQVKGEVTLDQAYSVVCLLLSQQHGCGLECLHQMSSFLYANLFAGGTRWHQIPLFLPFALRDKGRAKLAHELLSVRALRNAAVSAAAPGSPQLPGLDAASYTMSEEQFVLTCYQLLR